MSLPSGDRCALTERILATVRPHLRRRWRSRRVEENTPLDAEGLGLDSIRLLEMALACEDQFGIEIPIEKLAEVERPTFGSFVELVECALRT